MSELKEINYYLKRTVDLGGSDLHISAWAPPAARVKGQLVPLEDFILDPQAARRLIENTLGEADRAVLDQEWELDYALYVESVGRFRGNVHISRRNIEATFRHVQDVIPELESLGHMPVIAELCQLRRGLVLITGVTNSGKTTTLASMVKRISETRSGVIVTIEDPIEYVFSHRSCLIKQREVGTDTRAFPRALRQSLRQDADVIVVSELRDLETIRIALTAAETGHLVLGTLHTLDAPQTIDRMIDVFPSEQQQQVRTQLSGVLEAIVCQHLIRKPDGEKRVLATEILRANHGIRNCIRDRKLEQILGLMEIGSRTGNLTIDDALEGLYRKGQIDLEAALHHCRDRRRFEPQSDPADLAPKKQKSIWA